MVKPDHVPSNVAADKTKRNSDRTTFRDTGEVFIGAIPKLHGVIFDVVSTKKAGHFDASKKLIAAYLTKEFRRGGDIGHTILHMSKFKVPIPKKPKSPAGLNLDGSLTDDQKEDLAFLQSVYDLGAKSYMVRAELLEENCLKAFSVFLGQCTIAMIGRLESMPTWPDIRDTMDVLKFLELLKNVTYSFEGSRNYYHALIEVRKN